MKNTSSTAPLMCSDVHAICPDKLPEDHLHDSLTCSACKVDNDRDVNDAVNEMQPGRETPKPAWNNEQGWEVTTTALGPGTGEPETEFSLGLAVRPGPELGEAVFKLALDRRRENMQQAVIDYVAEQMRIHVALQIEIEKSQKTLAKVEARLKAIKAGEFSLDQRSGKITFNDTELRK